MMSSKSLLTCVLLAGLAAGAGGCSKDRNGSGDPEAQKIKPRTATSGSREPAGSKAHPSQPEGDQPEGDQPEGDGAGGTGAETAGLGVVEGVGTKTPELGLGEPLSSKNYQLDLKGPKDVAPGRTGQFELVLVPKGEYKANKLFPFKLELSSLPSGLKPSKKVLEKKDAKAFGPNKVVFTFELSATGSEGGEVKGLYKFSVCTPKFCETPKVRLRWDVPVNGPGSKKPARGRQAKARTSG